MVRHNRDLYLFLPSHSFRQLIIGTVARQPTDLGRFGQVCALPHQKSTQNGIVASAKKGTRNGR